MFCPVCGTQVVVQKDGLNYFQCGYKRSSTINSECGSFKTGPMKCTCDTKELFWRGCKCGWWEKEKALKNENNSRSVESVGI